MTTALAKTSDIGAIQGTFSDVERLSATLDAASQRCHLISPATSIGGLPEGCGVAITLVSVHPQDDTYDVGMGKRGLAKHALERISMAAGITWVDSRRIDDGSDPRYCAWHVAGEVRQFDGTLLRIVGSKEMDLRDGSPTIEGLIAKARMKRPPADATNQIRELRMHITAHAETKARLRAIRTMGLRTAYTPQELAKPFAVTKLAFTGQTDDPELRRAFAMKRADAMLAATRSLYGATAMAPMPHAPPLPPPALGSSHGYDGESAPAYLPPRAEPRAAPPPPPPMAPPVMEPPPLASAPQAPGEPAPAATRSGLTIPGGRSRGTAIEDAEDRDLVYWAERLEKSGTDADAERAAAMRAELARRAGANDDDQIPY